MTSEGGSGRTKRKLSRAANRCAAVREDTHCSRWANADSGSESGSYAPGWREKQIPGVNRGSGAPGGGWEEDAGHKTGGKCAREAENWGAGHKMGSKRARQRVGRQGIGKEGTGRQGSGRTPVAGKSGSCPEARDTMKNAPGDGGVGVCVYCGGWFCVQGVRRNDGSLPGKAKSRQPHGSPTLRRVLKPKPTTKMQGVL